MTGYDVNAVIDAVEAFESRAVGVYTERVTKSLEKLSSIISVG